MTAPEPTCEEREARQIVGQWLVDSPEREDHELLVNKIARALAARRPTSYLAGR